jgi:hypothetical protein
MVLGGAALISIWFKGVGWSINHAFIWHDPCPPPLAACTRPGPPPPPGLAGDLRGGLSERGRLEVGILLAGARPDGPGAAVACARGGTGGRGGGGGGRRGGGGGRGRGRGGEGREGGEGRGGEGSPGAGAYVGAGGREGPGRGGGGREEQYVTERRASVKPVTYC